ncbi:hypothetical protein [Actinomadura sp. 6N118]|uniref:hypothetical protein n=1 Tax=Actinomadura sp. 6N118 TaxID=3375151 RepID=UPI00379E2E04
MQTTHEMIVVGTDGSGMEAWECPSCGRRLLFRWPPQYEKVVVVPGDEQAIHVGGNGGVRIGAVEVTPAPEEVDESERSWLRESGIDWDASA